MIDPYFDYCAGPDWPFPFAAHDLGVYPKANGQAYRGFDLDRTVPVVETQMPIEECGNMLILAAALHRAEGELGTLQRWWPLLAQWADYLVDAGYDPGEQICTDDFLGVLGRNVNLCCKAAMALACAASIAAALGEGAAAARYAEQARSFAGHILAARDGDATRLAFDQSGTWSLKYNLIWDRVLGFGLFPETELRREQRFYATRVEACGVPLDNRSTLTKPEWMLWAGLLAEDRTMLEDIVERIVRYANTTPNRVPLADLYFAHNGRQAGFQARSVLGGLFMPFIAGAQGIARTRPLPTT